MSRTAGNATPKWLIGKKMQMFHSVANAGPAAWRSHWQDFILLWLQSSGGASRHWRGSGNKGETVHKMYSSANSNISPPQAGICMTMESKKPFSSREINAPSKTPTCPHKDFAVLDETHFSSLIPLYGSLWLSVTCSYLLLRLENKAGQL